MDEIPAPTDAERLAWIVEFEAAARRTPEERIHYGFKEDLKRWTDMVTIYYKAASGIRTQDPRFTKAVLYR